METGTVNARARNASMFALSVLLVGGFLAVVAYKVMTQQNAELEIGALIAGFGAVTQYWFGSSWGSARKTELLLGGQGNETEQNAPAIPAAGGDGVRAVVPAADHARGA